jgi:putative membrane protein
MISHPAANAVLNALSAVLLGAGYYFIRRQQRIAHQRCMVAACCTSLVFLVSYLVYHAYHGATRYTKEGWIRTVYFTILTTHTFLAVVILPLIILTLIWAWKDQLARHKKLARYTFPLWLYVSVTGVVIYWMLYQA